MAPGKSAKYFHAIVVVALGAAPRELWITAGADAIQRRLPHARAQPGELHLQIVRRETMPEALGLGDVSGLERERVDAVLGRDLACDLLGGAGYA